MSTAEVPIRGSRAVGLNLAERLVKGADGLVGLLDPAFGYTSFWKVSYHVRPAYMLHWGGPEKSVDLKIAETLAFWRAASGSDRHLDAEAELVKTILSRLSADDGLYYGIYTPDQPWHSLGHHGYEHTTEDTSSLVDDGVALRMLAAWQVRDGGGWERQGRALARGLQKIAIDKGSYAYYPDGGFTEAFSYPRSGWRHTREPMSEYEGGEGSVVTSHGYQIQGLVRWFQATGDEEALAFADKLAAFCMLPRFWGGTPAIPLVDGSAQGHIDSHVHGRCIALRSLLDYAAAKSDYAVMEFVRRSYEYMRMYTLPRLGYVSSFPRSRWADLGETCAIADMVNLGIRLSDYGVGDYWDDVDHGVRNHLAATQLLDQRALERVSESGFERPPGSPWELWVWNYEPLEKVMPGQESVDRVIERTLGTFGWSSTPTSFPNTIGMGCCSVNGVRGLYVAWESIVRSQRPEEAQVNLLLDRRSSWVDIVSQVPYAGRVDFTIKSIRRLSVRIPGWVDRRGLRIQVGGKERQPSWTGNYLVVDDLRPNDRVTVTFPVPDTTIHYKHMAGVWRQETDYTCRFLGSTLIDISPRDTDPGSYPLYMDREARYAPPEPASNGVDSAVPNPIPLGW